VVAAVKAEDLVIPMLVSVAVLRATGLATVLNLQVIVVVEAEEEDADLLPLVAAEAADLPRDLVLDLLAEGEAEVGPDLR